MKYCLGIYNSKESRVNTRDLTPIIWGKNVNAQIITKLIQNEINNQ